MASKAHRVVRGLVGGCAVLLGVAVTGCGAPQYTYVANSGADTYFKVPYGWHKISAPPRSETETGSSSGVWTVAYEAGASPARATSFRSTPASRSCSPRSARSAPPASNELSYDSLRDFFLPVTSTAQVDRRPEGFPLTDFKPDPRPALTPGQGVHGVRETFEYT